MTVVEAVTIIAVGIWFPGFIMFYLYYFFVLPRTRRWRDPEEIYYMQRRGMHTDERYVPRLVEELPYLVRKEMERALNGLKAEIAAMKSAVGPTLSPVSPSGLLVDESVQLVRELSHLLFTPLSEIEAVVLSLGSQPGDAQIPAQLSLETIRKSVDTCKSVLTAFRQLVRVAGTSGSWGPSSLGDALSSAADVYNTALSRNIAVDMALPDTVAGYSNSYITALLLPVLENALEASDAKHAVTVKGKTENGNFMVAITTTTDRPPESDKIYEPGYSTKEDHQGMGLHIVRHLLSAHEGASVSHECQGKRVTFTVKLPVKAESNG